MTCADLLVAGTFAAVGCLIFVIGTAFGIGRKP
jgi:hypothetical protein